MAAYPAKFLLSVNISVHQWFKTKILRDLGDLCVKWQMSAHELPEFHEIRGETAGHALGDDAHRVVRMQ